MEGMTVNSLNYENGKPGKVDIMGDGKGDIKGTVKDYVEKGYNPDKIFIDGQPASDVFQKDGKISFEGKNKKEVPNVRMGFYGIQKLPVKLNDEQVAEMNKTRQLPEGYQLMFCPKRTYSVNFIPAGEDPARLEIIKATDKNIARMDKRKVKHTDKLPKGFEVVNINDKTYLKEVTLDEKDTKKGIRNNIIKNGVAATLGIACLGLLSYCAVEFVKGAKKFK